MQCEAAAPKAASTPVTGTVLPGLGQPHGLAGLPMGSELLCCQPRYIVAFSLQLGGHQAAPRSWVMGIDAAPHAICNMNLLLRCMGMWLSTGRGRRLTCNPAL